MASTKVTAYLTTKCGETQATDPELAAEWDTIESLYTRRLWHQLTVKLLIFVRRDEFSTGTALVELYENVIKDLEDRINPVSLVTMLHAITEQIEDVDAAIALLEPIKEKIKYNDTATISITTMIAQLNMKEDRLDDAKKLLDECAHQLDGLPGVSPVHSDYYKSSSFLCKVQGRHADFYRESLRYLGTADASTITPEAAVGRAYDMGLAALIGPGIYNMGELLSHTILDSLKGTEKQWLVDLLQAFNSGDVAKFKSTRPAWSAHSQDLAACMPILEEKIALLSVMEVVFQRGSKNRTVAFDQIAAAADVPLDHVEKLVMKALSLDLVKGSIDEIDQVANFTWVQPRVLNVEQLSAIHERLGAWLETVDSAVNYVTKAAPELLVAN